MLEKEYFGCKTHMEYIERQMHLLSVIPSMISPTRSLHLTINSLIRSDTKNGNITAAFSHQQNWGFQLETFSKLKTISLPAWCHLVWTLEWISGVPLLEIKKFFSLKKLDIGTLRGHKLKLTQTDTSKLCPKII